MLALCWWEVEELLSHLSSRPDLWEQAEGNDHLWLRTVDDSLQCGIAILPPADERSPFRTFAVQEIPYDWDAEQTLSYITWLITNWTAYPNRLDVEEFLRTELSIDAAIASIAAIAIESFDWRDRKTPEPPDPPVQEELWSKDVPPRLLIEDASHIGTYLLSNSSGWVRLRLLGGMIRSQLSVRAKNGELISLDGFVRPLSSDARSAAAKLAGWPDVDDVKSTEWEGDFLSEEFVQEQVAEDHDHCAMHPDQPNDCPLCRPMIEEYDAEPLSGAGE
jgi:hypothetical protein